MLDPSLLPKKRVQGRHDATTMTALAFPLVQGKEESFMSLLTHVLLTEGFLIAMHRLLFYGETSAVALGECVCCQDSVVPQ